MKVLFLNPWDRLIGPNRYLIEMLRCLPELARRSTVVFHEKNAAMDDYVSAGCRVLICPEITQIRARFSLDNIGELILRHSLGLSKLIKLVRYVKPDLVVSNTEQLLMGDIVSGIFGIRHIKIFHAMTFAYRLGHRPKIMKAYLKALTFGSYKVVAVSDTLRKALISGGVKEEKVVTVPNPIPVDALRTFSGEIPPNIRRILDDHNPVLLSAGQFFPKKGQDQLIEALPSMRKIFPDLVCIFAGKTGESSGAENTEKYYHSLLTRVDELGLKDAILFAGEVDYLPLLMGRADVYVQTSWTESFNRAAAEALVCGAPVVAYNAGATGEVTGLGAILVKPGDKEGLAGAVVELLQHPQLRKQMAVSGAEHVAARFDAAKVAGRFEKLLETESNAEDINRCSCKINRN